MTMKEHFAAEHGLPLAYVTILCDRVEAQVQAQTRAHNEPRQSELHEERAHRLGVEIEMLAKACGFDGVRWDNLYPTLVKGDKKFIELPLQD